MARFEHGGDVYSAAGARRDIRDFSSNLNPLGMPEEVVRAVRDAAHAFDAYPDPRCRELRCALAQKLGVSARQVVCTAGASDLIQRLCLALRPQSALVAAPCFSGYEQALGQVGARIVRHRLRAEEGFAVTGRFLDEVSSLVGQSALERGVVFLGSPNNPTGLTVPRAIVRSVLEATRGTGVLVVIDECFLGFTGEESAVRLCGDYPHLVVMRAFTKTYAMAGLRLGYGVCADVRIVQELEGAGQPWAVSTPAQVAGVAALGVAGWMERTRAYVDAERAFLGRGLKGLGMGVIPGQANYLLFRSPVPLYGPLLEHGFLVRRCENFEGLDESWYRVAARTHGENAALLDAVSRLAGERGRRT